MEKQINEERVDYRKMYYHLAGEVETAIRQLIAAQQACEEILLEGCDAENCHCQERGDTVI